MNTMNLLQSDPMSDSLTTLKGSLVLMKNGLMGPVNREQDKFLSASLEALEKIIEVHDRSFQVTQPSPTRRLLTPRLSLTSVHI